MPSSLHETLVDLFRANLRLIELLAAPLLPLPPGGLGVLRVEDANLTDPRPVERRADLAIVPAVGPVFVVEVQLSVDPVKRWTWPSYAARTRDRLRREVVLVVVTLSEGVADWAGEAIRLDALGSRLCPLVIGPAQIPLVTDLGAVRAAPEQLVLGALVHGRGPSGVAIARAAAAVAPFLDEERGRFYIDLVSSALGPAARAALESAMFENYEYRSELFRKLVAEGEALGVAKGEALGVVKGEALGVARGEVKGKAEALLMILDGRQIPVDAERRAQILATNDLATVNRYLTHAFTATTLDEVFAEPRPVANRSGDANDTEGASRRRRPRASKSR